MIDSLLKILETTVIPMGGIGVFLAAFFEEVIAPIPSSAVLLVSGFLFLGELSIGSLVFWKIFILTIIIPAALGMTLGSLVLYGIFYLGGKKAVEKWGKYFGISLEQLEKVERRLEKSRADEIFLVVFRSLPLVPNMVVSAVFGTFRMPLAHYLPFTFLGSAIRATAMGLLGWSVGELYYTYADIIGRFEDYMLMVILLLAFFFLLYRVALMRRK